MKTKLALTILGAYNALMGSHARHAGHHGRNIGRRRKGRCLPEMLEMGTMFHYGLAPRSS